MKTTGPQTRWLLSAALYLIIALAGGVSFGATPQSSAGSSHTIFLHSDGTLWGAGQNAFGQLGDGTLKDHAALARIGSDTSWAQVASGLEHNLALKADGTLWAWGDNSFGQLGITNNAGVPVAGQSRPVQVGSGRSWIAVAASGGASSFALKADGTLWAWGDNSLGQLGNGNPGITQLNQPTQVTNPSGFPFVAVAASAGHTLALKADGSLWAWGSNAFGELGSGNLADSATPQQVILAGTPSDNDWRAVAAGDAHSLALKADGSLWSWGSNALGQLGQPSLGTSLPQLQPVQVGNQRDWSAIAAGASSSLALKRDGTLWGFGDNSRGQLGSGQNAPLSISPIPAPGGSGDLVFLAAGSLHALALKSDGTLYAFGDNGFGQFGSGSTQGSNQPVAVSRDALGWLAGDAGGQYTLARRSNGTLWSWGDNFSGQLGNGDPGQTPQLIPGRIGTAGNWSGHAAGLEHALALKSDGTLWAWGDNSKGQLGSGNNNPSLIPIQIANTNPAVSPNNWAAVSAGDFHTLALRGDGTLWAWGDNSFGQLGNGDVAGAPVSIPTQVLSPGAPGNFDSTWIAVSAGGSHSLALQSDGTIWVWGDNSLGQLGDTTLVGGSNVPSELVLPGASWKAIAAGLGHSLALKADGSLFSWGDNSSGQLGDGNAALASSGSPVPVLNGSTSGYLAIAVGDSHSAARRSDGTLWSWGSDLSGQLGNGSAVAPNAIPVQEAGLALDWASQGSGSSHSLALKANGTLWDWGNNASGQLGDGSTTNRNAPAALLEAFANLAPSLDFGTRAVSSGPVTLALAVNNPGNQPLSLSAPAFSGPDSALFGLTLGACAQVAAGASCPLQLTFTPNAAAGAKSALLTLASNDPVQPQHQVALSAQLQQFIAITTSVNPVGAGSISGPLQVLPGSSPNYLITAAFGFHITDVQLGGVSQGAATSLTLAGINAGTSIAAFFALNPHQVTLQPGANGTISGPTAVLQNDTPSYQITPATGFHVADVTVNGVSQGAVTALTLPAITGDVTIAASFAVNSFSITLSPGANGSITGPLSATFGSTPVYSITPATGFHVTDVTLNGVSQGALTALTIPAIGANATVAASFAINSYTITLSPGANGSITGPTTATFGATPSYSITPNLGAFVTGVTVNGVPQGTPSTLTLPAVSGDVTVAASFGVTTFTVAVTSDAKGSVSPAGSTAIPFGASQSFSFTPNAGYHVVNVVADGVPQGALASFTFNNVTANGHTLKVSFIPDGDLNGDGAVTVADALRALQIAVNLVQATPAELLHGDVAPLDGAGVPVPDNQITVADALNILRKAVGLASGF